MGLMSSEPLPLVAPQLLPELEASAESFASSQSVGEGSKEGLMKEVFWYGLG